MAPAAILLVGQYLTHTSLPSVDELSCICQCPRLLNGVCGADRDVHGSRVSCSTLRPSGDSECRMSYRMTCIFLNLFRCHWISRPRAACPAMSSLDSLSRGSIPVNTDKAVRGSNRIARRFSGARSVNWYPINAEATQRGALRLIPRNVILRSEYIKRRERTSWVD